LNPAGVTKKPILTGWLFLFDTIKKMK